MLRNIFVFAIVAALYFNYINCENFTYIAWCNNGHLVTKFEMTDEDRKLVLDAHNKYRKKMAEGYCNQPKAVGLNDLIYDGNLEGGAEAACTNCEFKHIIYNDDPYYKIGQNMAKTSRVLYNSTFDWQDAVDDWMSECKDFTYPNISAKVTGHYEQVVADRTERVGCYGIIYHRIGKFPPFETLYYCNYYPSGNWNNGAPYEIV